ncbi:MAG: flavodoxin domain-containing protein [Candidatus Aegiribacteria sp.]|nr:flavodoxin domain-containing protein [Candidatus Aegiribacteria sp.]
MMKNVLIAYMSYFGNSRKCAGLFTDELKSRGFKTQLISIKENEKPSDEWDTLVVFSPVRMGRVVGKTRKFIRKLNGSGKDFVLVISHGADLGQRFSPVKPTEKLQTSMTEKGMMRVTDPTYIKVVSNEGPPVEGFENILSELAGKLENSQQ